MIPLVIMGFVREMKKEDRGINNVTVVVDVMRKNLQEETKQFKNFVIVEIGQCDREKDTCIPPEPLVGIRKFHSIWINKHGELRGNVLSCDNCTVSERCDTCDERQEKREDTKFICDICHKGCASKGGLTRHTNSKHKK